VKQWGSVAQREKPMSRKRTSPGQMLIFDRYSCLFTGGFAEDQCCDPRDYKSIYIVIFIHTLALHFFDPTGTSNMGLESGK